MQTQRFLHVSNESGNVIVTVFRTFVNVLKDFIFQVSKMIYLIVKPGVSAAVNVLILLFAYCYIETSRSTKLVLQINNNQQLSILFACLTSKIKCMQTLKVRRVSFISICNAYRCFP